MPAALPIQQDQPLAPRVLVVDDEPKLLASLAEGFVLEGWRAATAATAHAAIAACERESFHVIVLDWMLPDHSGIDCLRILRRRGCHAPVLMLTARGAVSDRVEGFAAGVDDYLVKPFAFLELVARCRALVRRQLAARPPLLRCGDLELDPQHRVVRRGGREIPLTPRELDVLEYLMRQRERPVTRETLAREVWREPDCSPAVANAINIQVNRLRQKIEAPDGRRLILTVHGIGYALAA